MADSVCAIGMPCINRLAAFFLGGQALWPIKSILTEYVRLNKNGPIAIITLRNIFSISPSQTQSKTAVEPDIYD